MVQDEEEAERTYTPISEHKKRRLKFLNKTKINCKAWKLRNVRSGGRDYRGMESVWHAAAKKEEVVASRGIMQSATTDRNVFPPLILHSDRARSCLIAGCRKKYFPFLKNRFGGQNSMGSINDFSRKNHFFLSPILSYVFHNLVNCFDTPFVNYSKLRMYCKPP